MDILYGSARLWNSVHFETSPHEHVGHTVLHAPQSMQFSSSFLKYSSLPLSIGTNILPFHFLPSSSITPFILARIATPFSSGSCTCIYPASTAFCRSLSPFSEFISTNVAFPTRSPVTPQLPQAISELFGTFIVQYRQLSRLPYPFSSSSSIVIACSFPSLVSKMSFPFSISSPWTSSGFILYITSSISRVTTGCIDPPQFNPTI